MTRISSNPDDDVVIRHARRLLAVRTDNVGDIVMLAPALRALKQAAPDAHLTVMASPAGAAAAPLVPWIDDVVVECVVWQDATGELAFDPGREMALVDRIRAARYDAALLFTSFSQSPWPAAYACYLAGVPVRAGESKEFGGSLLTHEAPSLLDGAHQVDRNLHLIEALGLTGSARPAVVVPEAARDSADDLLVRAGVARGEPYVVVAPGATARARRYPRGRVAAVVDGLVALGVRVVVVGRDGDDVGLPVDRQGVSSITGRTTVTELAAVIERAGVVVCNNSGPLHLADALGRPLVVTYSGTDLHSQWAPRNVPARLLDRPVPCSPCYGFDCPYDRACLDVPPSEVVAAAVALFTTDDERKAVCANSGS